MERAATPRSDQFTRTADALTLARGLIAVILIPVVSAGQLTTVSVLVVTAWLSDFLDGRLARMSDNRTRLGGWDLTADTAVGAGLVIGLVGEGTIPLTLGVAALVIFGGLFLAGNLAASMLLQLSGFVPLFLLLFDEKPFLWWLPPLVAIAIGLADWRRLVFVNIPAFLRGITGRFENR